MRNILRLTLLILFLPLLSVAQQPDTGSIRVVDTLTSSERSSRNIILLRSELDSIINAHAQRATRPLDLDNQVTPVEKGENNLLLTGVGGILLLLLLLIFLVNRHQQKITRIISGNRSEMPPVPDSTDRKIKGRSGIQAQENRITGLQAELLKLTRENEGLNRVISEYNGIRHEYESLKHGIMRTYKVKNYPGNDKKGNENLAMQGVFDTEISVANYAYEKFLKPVLAIADRNKNNPARVSDADRRKVLDLLVSLSLLYTEYLYLRVNDLSVGGKMVERIKDFAKGNGPDPSLLKKMNTESGNRALVLRMILNKSDLQHLSYPVFDETNLNNQ